MIKNTLLEGRMDGWVGGFVFKNMTLNRFETGLVRIEAGTEPAISWSFFFCPIVLLPVPFQPPSLVGG